MAAASGSSSSANAGVVSASTASVVRIARMETNRNSARENEQLQPFENRGGRLAEADAHRLQAELHVALLHLVEQRGHETRARAAQRVAQGHRAAVHVPVLELPAQLPGPRP